MNEKKIGDNDDSKRYTRVRSVDKRPSIFSDTF